MNISERYTAYADAFEETLADDDWSRLEQYFAEGVVYRPGGGESISGREAVLAYMRDSVNAFDRRVDARELANDGPSEEGSQVSIAWTGTYRIDGAPDLVMNGTETATFEDGVIAQLVDVFDEGVTERLGAWMEANGDKLS